MALNSGGGGGKRDRDGNREGDHHSGGGKQRHQRPPRDHDHDTVLDVGKVEIDDAEYLRRRRHHNDPVVADSASHHPSDSNTTYSTPWASHYVKQQVGAPSKLALGTSRRPLNLLPGRGGSGVAHGEFYEEGDQDGDSEARQKSQRDGGVQFGVKSNPMGDGYDEGIQHF